MNAADVDLLLSEPAVVFGSLPPGGRDLDLLVSSDEAGRLYGALRAAGWLQAGSTFARFADCTAYAVDVIDGSEWALNDQVVNALFAQSVPLEGYEHLRSPAAHHRLLILADRIAKGDRLAPRHVEVVQAYGATVWAHAMREAPRWGRVAALKRLRDLASGASARATSVHRTPRPRAPRVIALSGLDGCGKSTQANYLCDALSRLGIDARVQWTKIGRDPVLDQIAAPVKAVLSRLPEVPIPAKEDACAVEEEERHYPDGPPPEPSLASRWRSQVPLLTWGWSFVVVLANAANHRRSLSQGGEGVVVCDRYRLDSQAHLRYRYPSAGRFALQSWLVRRLSPKPVCEIFLDVSPAVARARKAEQYTTADLLRLRECYRSVARGSGVRVMDAERPVAEVAAEVAETAWRAVTEARTARLRAAIFILRRRPRAWRPRWAR